MDDLVKLALSMVGQANDDEGARQTAQALVAAHVGTDNRIINEKQFIEAIAAALIVAGTAAALRRPLVRPYIVTAENPIELAGKFQMVFDTEAEAHAKARELRGEGMDVEVRQMPDSAGRRHESEMN